MLMGSYGKMLDSLYDMNNGENSVMVKTSVNGGLSFLW
jgi:hypothetical protein